MQAAVFVCIFFNEYMYDSYDFCTRVWNLWYICTENHSLYASKNKSAHPLFLA